LPGHNWAVPRDIGSNYENLAYALNLIAPCAYTLVGAEAAATNGSGHEQVDQGDESGADARGDQEIIDPEVTLDVK
jgi:hypothetical protein